MKNVRVFLKSFYIKEKNDNKKVIKGSTEKR